MVDFIPFDTNKAKGVEKYQEILGIRPEECIVFGDEYNDIAMLKSVPYSCNGTCQRWSKTGSGI